MFRRLVFLFSAMIVLSACTGWYSTATDENLRYLAMVAEALDHKDSYLAEFEGKVNEIKQQLATSTNDETTYFYLRQLTEAFMGYHKDSALIYNDQNIEIANRLNRTDWLAESYIKRSQIYNSAGLTEESRMVLDRVKTFPMEQENKLRYWTEEISYWRNHNIQFDTQELNTMVTAFADSIMLAVPDTSSPYYVYARTWHTTDEADRKFWQQELMKYADSMDSKNPWYKYITECAALMSWANNDIDNRLKYFALSIVTKISQVDRHVPYLADLGTVATNLGELFYASRFYDATLSIQVDHPEYVFNGDGALGRLVMQFHDAVEKRLEEQNKQNITLNYLLSGFILLTIILLLVTLAELRKVRSLHKELEIKNKELIVSERSLRETNEQLRAEEKKLSDTNSELTEANMVKEEYIGQLFATCSSYLDKMDTLKKNIGRKLKAGQYAEAIKQTQTISQKDNEDMQELWAEFDQVFLRLYPDFVSQFNSLLREEEQVSVKPEGRLNTDLRIYALIRLGIDSSVKISKMLGVSVQTVYNARTKMRGKATPSDTDFDLRVRQLKPSLTAQ